MAGASLLGEVGFAPTFSDPAKSSYKLMEVDEAMLRYLLGEGSLQLKARPGCDLVACTGDSTFSVTLVESSNTMLLMSSGELAAAEGGGDAKPTGTRHLVYGAAPGVLELHRIAPALHVLRSQLVKHALDQGSIDGYKHSCARSAGVSSAAAGAEAGELEVGVAGLPSKRQRTGSGSEALAGLTRQSSDASTASRSSGPAGGRRGAVQLGVSMGALLEGVPASAAEVAAGLAALRAVRVPASFLAYLEACGAALRADESEPDAEAADDDDVDAVAARAAGREVYTGCQHDAGALWSVVDEECAFAVLQAALLAASAYAWDLAALPVDDLVEQLSHRFPRFLTRHVLCTVFGPPPSSAARGPVAAAVAEAEVPLLTRFLGTTQAAALTVLAPPAVAAALLRHDAVKVEAFMREWAAAMPAEMLADTLPTSAAPASASGEGRPAEDASSGSLSLDLLPGLVLVTAPPAGPGGSGASASAAVGASVGFAASVAPTLRYFPQDLLAHEPGPRFKQLFSVRPKWAMEELAPFIAPLAGSKGGAGAPAVPGKTMDELLLAFTRVTYLPGGGKLFSAR